jgi:VanZ family protein
LICFAFEGAEVRVSALVGAVMLGALLEWGQSYVPGRTMSLADGIVNTSGVVSGALLYRFRESLLRGRTKSRGATSGRRVE